MPIRIMASRHSLFYSPLLCCVRLLEKEGREVTYRPLAAKEQTYALIRDGAADIVQSAVSSNWKARERGVEPLPVHFAQINQRDGFFLAGRESDSAFDWKKLEGCTLLADHGAQPLVMLKYAARHNGVDWKKIKVRNSGDPARMEEAFRSGTGDYVHLQGPVAVGEIVVSVGASMPPVAFSSVCCGREFQKSEPYRIFLEAYGRAREWARSAPPEAVASDLASFFPQHSAGLLADTVKRYQALGCWDGGVEIPRDLYEQALNVFQSAGEITWRHRYEEVVG